MYANLERTDKVSENDLSKIMMEHGALNWKSEFTAEYGNHDFYLVGDIEDWLGY
tara:strand:+ start:119 stop:280 length:162 start_codon:yes stop_codon:yes gene_type:complete